MDLLTLKAVKADTGSVLVLKDPATDVPLPATITLLGSDSSKYRAIQRRKQQAALDRLARGKKSQRLIAAELEEDGINDLAEMTVAWTEIELGNEVLECNVENAKRVYTELPWVKEQAQEFLADRGNFIQG